MPKLRRLILKLRLILFNDSTEREELRNIAYKEDSVNRYCESSEYELCLYFADVLTKQIVVFYFRVVPWKVIAVSYPDVEGSWYEESRNTRCLGPLSLFFFLTPSVLRLALFSAVTAKEFQETLLRPHKNFDVPSKHHPDCCSLHCIVSLLD